MAVVSLSLKHVGVKIPGLSDIRRGLPLSLILLVLAGGGGEVLCTFQCRDSQTVVASFPAPRKMKTLQE